MPLPNFNFYRRGGVKVWVDGSLALPAFVDSLARADRWFDDPTCQIVKDEEKTKVGRLKVKIAGREHAVFLKQFNAASLRHRLASLFVRSRAFRTLQGAAVLLEAGVPMAAPFAAVEKRQWRGASKSFFVTGEVAGGETTDAFWQERLRPLGGREGFCRRRAFLSALAALFRTLHGQRIYHNDLKDANILAVKNTDHSVSFFLLDLEGVRRCSWLSERRRVKNLVQLHRTLGRYLRRSEKLYFLKSYLGPSYADRRSTRELVSRVLRQSRRLEARKARQGWGLIESLS
jgi:hypothetical protein